MRISFALRHGWACLGYRLLDTVIFFTIENNYWE